MSKNSRVMTRPLLVVFLGFPGSGKTYFARRLAEWLPAVTFNSDALRVAMFGSIENVERIRQNDQSRLYDDVFGAMNYATRQVLKAGCSVVFDAQQTKREDRRRVEELAKESGEMSVLVWIKTSRETALRRGQEREVGDDSHVYDAEKMAYLIDRFAAVTDLPEANENIIEISGEVPFDKQYEVFVKALGEVQKTDA